MNFNELQILRLAYNLNQLASNQVGSSAESRCRKSIGIENLIVLRAYRATSNNNQFVNLTALLLISPSTHVLHAHSRFGTGAWRSNVSRFIFRFLVYKWEHGQREHGQRSNLGIVEVNNFELTTARMCDFTYAFNPRIKLSEKKLARHCDHLAQSNRDSSDFMLTVTSLAYA